MFNEELDKNNSIMSTNLKHVWSLQLCEDDTLGVPKIEP